MRPTPALLKRSVWKGPNIIPRLAPSPRRQAQATGPNTSTSTTSTSPSSPTTASKASPTSPSTSSRIIYTKARSATILPSFVGHRFGIHNGHKYEVVLISEDMVNMKLGEFAATRRRFTFKEGKGR